MNYLMKCKQACDLIPCVYEQSHSKASGLLFFNYTRLWVNVLL